MAKYLDLTGLQTFWTKIKTYISNSVTTNTPSASKTITGFNEGKITYGNIAIGESQVTNLTTHLNAKAPLASPDLTGKPTAPTAADGTNTTQIATTAFVNTAITSKMAQADAMIYKGTVDGAATTSTNKYGALTPAADKGATYKVKTAGYIDGVKVEVGDMLICNTDSTAQATASNYTTIKDNWDFIQGNLDGVVIGPSSSVSGNVVLFDGTTGKLVKDSGFTIGKSVPADAKFTDTTYSSKEAASGGTDVSLVTTGEKAIWNAKTSNTGTVTSVAVKMNGAVKGTVTSSGTIDLGTVITSHQSIAGKADKATNLTGDTKCKITYNSQGIVTAGADLTADDIPELTVSKISDFPSTATTSTDGLMSSTDKSKLDGIATGANKYVHPTTSGNKHIPSGGSSGQILRWSADGTAAWGADTDTNDTKSGLAVCSTAAATAAKIATMPGFALETGASILLNVTVANSSKTALTLNVNNTGAKAIKINGTSTSTTVYNLPIGYYWAKYDGTSWDLKEVKFTDTTYSNKAAASGGTDVSLVTTGDKYTWNNKASTAKVSKTADGLCPQLPNETTTDKYLRQDGTWVKPPNTTYSVATTSANGLMSSTDKSKLDGIEEGANNYVHPTDAGNKHIPSGGSSGQILRWSADGTAAWGADNDTKNTAGTTNNASTKMFLVGAIEQSANPRTYSNVNVYIGTDNCLYSNAKKVCTEEYASSTYEPKMTAITDDEIAALT